MSKKAIMVGSVAAALAACGQHSATDPFDGSADGGAVVEPGNGHEASRNDDANVPSFLWAEAQSASSSLLPLPSDPVAAARHHIARYATRYRLTPAQVAALEVRDVHDTGRGVKIVRFFRKIDGVEVLGEQISVAMERSLALVGLTGFVTGDLPRHMKPRGARARSAFRVDAATAMAAAMADLSGAPLAAGDFEAPVPAAAGYQQMALRGHGARRARAGGDARPVRGKPVFVRKGGTLEPAYVVDANLGTDAGGQPRAFLYVVSASDGAVIQKHDMVRHHQPASVPAPNPASYRVWAETSGLFIPHDDPTGGTFTPNPTGRPDNLQPDRIPSSTITLSSLTQIGITDPWLPPGATETRGNNVEVYTDSNAPDGFTPETGDVRGQVSAPGTFDHAYDFGIDASASPTNQQAGMAQLFYTTNWLHDWYYVAGFDEASGNAQRSNYGRGGVEGDPLLVESQDSAGFNNAFLAFAPDGASPVMTMFRWTVPVERRLTATTPGGPTLEFTRPGTASFGPRDYSVTAQLVRTTPLDGCTPLIGDYTGKIVLFDRGGCPFSTKVANANAANTAGAIIANVATSLGLEVPGVLIGGDLATRIPSMTVNFSDGNQLRAAVDSGAPVTVTMRGVIRFIDGGLDSLLVAHEWGHYISTRLVLDGFGLSGTGAAGLSEGYADFHALLLAVREEDTRNPLNAMWNGTYSSSSFAFAGFPVAYYTGGRRYPYSTDLTKNPLTFRHISDAVRLPAFPQPAPVLSVVNSEIHNTGEVWAQMLWECYTALLRDTLGPAPRLTFSEARDRMRDYLVASYKLVPAFPTLTEARDALLLAAQVNDRTDFRRFGEAFARRGAGSNAVSPPRGGTTNTPVVESFVFGPAVSQVGAVIVDDVSPQCGGNGILDNGEVGTLQVTFRNVGGDDTPELDARVTSQTIGVKLATERLIVPKLPRGGTAVAKVRVAATRLAPISTIKLTVTTPNAGAGDTEPPVSYSFPANAQELPGISSVDTAERNQVVWQVTASDSATAWRKDSTSVNNRTYHAESSLFQGSTELTSPPLAVLPGVPLTLAFNHRYSFDDQFFAFDGGIIEISSDDGATWTNLFDLGIDVPYTAFIDGFGNPIDGQAAFTNESFAFPDLEPVAIDLGTGFGGQTIRLRFRVGSDSLSPSYGWDVDDITLGGIAGTPFPGLAPKVCNPAPRADAGAAPPVQSASATL